MNLDIYRGTLNLTIPIDENTTYSKALMGEWFISCETIASTALDIQIGDTITYGTETYTIQRLPDIEKINDSAYKYTIIFQSDFSQSQKKLYMSDGLAEFSLNGTAEDFLDLWITNMNTTSSGWSKGTVTSTDPVTMDFSNEYCSAVIVRIAEQFKLEFDSVAKVVSMTNAIGTTTALTFEYGRGKGLYNLVRQQVQNQNILTRVYGFGGERNLGSSYRSRTKKLVFEDAGVRYLEKNVATYGVIEGQFTDENIYPHRTGTLTAANIVFTDGVFDSDLSYIEDSSIDFDINDYLLEGQSALINFKTGDLAGIECEIWKYDHANHRIYFNAHVDPQDSYVTPNYNSGTPIEPKVGDTYTLLDISMPQSYIDTAELDLKTKTQAFLDENCVPQVVYTVDIDPRYAKGIAAFGVGDKVTVKDTAIGINNLIRISAIEFPLVQPYKIKATIADFVPYTLYERVIKEVINERKETKFVDRRQHDNYRRATSNQKILQSLIYDPDGYFNTGNIRPLSIETAYVAVGILSSDFFLSDVTIITNYNGDEDALYVSAGSLLHNQLEVAGLGSIWVMSPALSASGLTPASHYYLYAKCSKTALTGTWVLSDAQIGVEDVAGYYHFYTGNLFAVNDSRRDFDFIKGMTYIVGDTIKTGRVQSLDGQCYLDLTHAQFRVGDANSFFDWNVTAADTLTLKGVLVQTSTGAEPIPVFMGTYDTDTVYSKGNQVFYGGSTWTYINQVSSSGNTPVEGLYWTISAAQGVDGEAGEDGVDGSDGISVISQGSYANEADLIADKGALQSGWSYYNTTDKKSYVYYNPTWYLVASDGADGENAYFHRAWADDAFGTNFNLTYYSGALYIGTYSDNTLADSETYTDYVWSIFKGEAGAEGQSGISILMISEAHVCPVNDGTIDYTSSGNAFGVYEGSTQLTVDQNYPYGNGTFRVSVSYASNITAGTASGADGTNYRYYGVANSLTADSAYIDFIISVTKLNGDVVNFTKRQTFAKSLQGNDGAAGAGIVFRGEFSATTPYYNNTLRRDVVKYSGSYYIFKGIDASYGSWSSSNWDSFGASFSSVATEVLFAAAATIPNLIAERIRTATSGTRIEINMADSNSIEIFDASNHSVVKLDDTAGYDSLSDTDYPGLLVGYSTKSIVSPNGFYTNGGGVRVFESNIDPVSRAGFIADMSVNVNATYQFIAGFVSLIYNSGSAPTYAHYSNSDFYTTKHYIGKGFKHFVDPSNRMTLPNINNLNLESYASYTFIEDGAKSSNLTRYLPSASTFGVGRTLFYANRNDFDAAIYPATGQTINGYTGSSKHITLVDPGDCVQLIAVASDSWTIISLRGSF